MPEDKKRDPMPLPMQHQKKSANFGTHITSPIIGTKPRKWNFR